MPILKMAGRRSDQNLDTGARFSGNFEIDPDREIFGELTVDERNTRLYLRDDEFFHTHSLQDRYLRGTDHDLRAISLFDCVTLSGPGTGWSENRSFTFAELFPHHIARGRSHLGARERAVNGAIFSIDDGHAIFYDFDALGSVLEAEALAKRVANANQRITNRKVRMGPRPRIHYFAGRVELLRAATAIGDVVVNNLVDELFGSPKRLALESRIVFEVSWGEPVEIRTALNQVSTLMRFLELIVGRPQNRKNLLLRVGEDNAPTFLQVYSTMLDRYDHSMDDRPPGPSDVLLDGVRQPFEMREVMAKWLALDDERREARLRFAHVLNQSRSYGFDRLIGAANMFDLLPSSAVPKKVPIGKALRTAKDQSRAIFENLPDSPERQSVLSVLGRLGTSSLPQKILHRVKILTKKIPDQLADIELIARQAVKCRNHYVHGSEPSYDYLKDGDAIPFFTSTLEFIFGASELVECGWKINHFNSGANHPFGELLREWRPRVANVQARLAEIKQRG